MGVMCQIFVNRYKEGAYRPDRSVTGVVKYALDEKTEFNNITLSLVGKGRCAWTENHGKRSTTLVGTEDIVNIQINVLNRQRVTIPPGSYEYPFHFHLPNDIPPSLKNSICTIKYQIIIKFEKSSLFSFNKKFSIELPVYGYVSPQAEGPIIFGLEKELLKLFSVAPQKVTLKAEMEKCHLTPGENARMKVYVTNDSDVKVTSVKIELYSYTTYTSNSGRTNKSNKREKNCLIETLAVNKRAVRTFDCIVPSRPELYSIQHSKVMSREYRYRVTLRLPLPHINATVEVPVVIGERKHAQLHLEELPDLEESPPSYWEAMQEDKEKEK